VPQPFPRAGISAALLTALLVLQASLYQTIRSALRKVLSVTLGVLVAVGVAEFIGFSWWQLALGDLPPVRRNPTRTGQLKLVTRPFTPSHQLDVLRIRLRGRDDSGQQSDEEKEESSCLNAPALF